MRWSENQTFEFVKLYFSYEYLWNSEHEDYKLNKLRLKAYRDIVSEFNTLTGISLSISEIKSKIKNLRSTYSQELNKIKFRSGPHYTYEPTIKWFTYWHKRFQQLRVSKLHDSLATFEESGVIDNDSQKLWNADETGNTSDEANLQSLIPENNNDLNLYLKSEPEDTVPIHIDRHSPRKIRRKKIKQRIPISDMPDVLQYSLDSNVKLDKDDEFDIYGKYIASQLRSMDLKKSLRLQLQIQRLISKGRLSN
ncbi:uncharacterized protein LOC123660343 [Melitaea cinxia]|uniref:uncharacterized protein LOC123660343 n=1 Tax=Melitaea cinxia TaxID=113334 RepID=UPI001E26F0FA|nr:uncharacterized protein LOC123660343 [Melitaea cinxia]